MLASWDTLAVKRVINVSKGTYLLEVHDDAIKWKHFPRYWPFVRGIHRSMMNFHHKGQWRGALMVSLICARINGWVNNGEALSHCNDEGDVKMLVVEFDILSRAICEWFYHHINISATSALSSFSDTVQQYFTYLLWRSKRRTWPVKNPSCIHNFVLSANNMYFIWKSHRNFAHIVQNVTMILWITDYTYTGEIMCDFNLLWISDVGFKSMNIHAE